MINTSTPTSSQPVPMAERRLILTKGKVSEPCPDINGHTVRAKADRFAANILPVIEQIKAAGATSLRAIARALNARGIATARGGVWTPVQVTAVLRRVC
jgi:hypothetical protein